MLPFQNCLFLLQLFDYSKFSNNASVGALHNKDSKVVAEVNRSRPSTLNSMNSKSNKLQPFRVKQEVVNPYLFNSGMDDKI